MPKPEHALIEVVKGTHDSSGKLPERFYVQFNPTEYTLSKSVQIAEIGIPGLDTPLLQYVRGQNEKLTLDLLFDGTIPENVPQDVSDLDALVERFYLLVKIQSKTHAPPIIRFSWGTLSFQAVVESIQRKCTLFDPDGKLLRATLSVTLREYMTLEEQVSKYKLESPDYTKQRVVQRGDTLSRIAGEEYDDPGLWRLIADKNKLANPLSIKPGMVLIIPPLGEPIIEA